jgi:hypothetical protein
MGQIMLGFVVRQCAIALGHAPSPAELMEWANHQGPRSRPYCLFGRAITVTEARVILRHPGRPVTVREEGPQPLFALGVAKDTGGSESASG